MCMRKQVICLLITLSAFAAGCQTTRQVGQSAKRKDNYTYFQPSAQYRDSVETVVSTTYLYRLQPGDIIAIAVSSLNADLDEAFNPYSRFNLGNVPGTSTATGQANSSNNLPVGFRVTEQGTINFPKLGLVQVAGSSIASLEIRLKDTLTTYLREPFVAVRLLSFKVSVLGEVVRPSVFTVQNEKLTLPEAISIAGDLTLYGQRENILIVREVAGKREFGRINLTDRNLFDSPFYYLKPNDVIYVQPKKGKRIQAGQLFPYIPSVLAALTLISTLILNFRK